jgi:hypothetical protein
MWVHRSGEFYKDRQIVLFEYQKTRHHEHPENYYRDYKGVLVTDGLKQYHLIEKNLKGVQVFHKEDVLKAIKRHNLFYANEIKMDNDEQGEHLILTFDDTIVCFELIWRNDGPRLTLIEIRLA